MMGETFNGLTEGERRYLDHLRSLVAVNLAEAQRAAVIWIRSNRRRSALRRSACATIKGMFSA